MEKKIWIPCSTHQLEGMFSAGEPGRGAAVITHPHPLYGGNMDNPVVVTLARAFQARGYATLRFNFRGTDGSTGRYDDGVGEMVDVAAALDYLDAGPVILAGYSFGSRVNAGFMAGKAGAERVSDHIMVSPPVAFSSFDDVKTLPKTGLVVTGSRDEIAPPDQVESVLDGWEIHPRLEIITGGDHFYSGCLERLESIVDDYLAG